MGNEPTCRFIPTAEVRPGHKLAGVTVTGVRISKSGKTVFLTVLRGDGTSYTFSQAANTKSAVFE